MNKKQRMGSFKKVVGIVFILIFFLSWQTNSYSQEISKPVTYRADFKPLGDGIDWEGSVPDDFDALHLLFKFKVNPGTVETEINGNIIFDQDNQTLSVQTRTVTDLKGNLFVGKFEYSAGVLLSGEIIFDFVLPIPFFPDIPIYHALDIPGFPQIDEGWQDEKFFNSLLLEDGESVKVEGGVRNLLSTDITAVEVAELLAIVLSQGSLPQQIADKAGDIIKTYIGDGGIRLNGGLKNRFTLSGVGIYVDGQLITSEDQSVSTPGLNPALDSYSIHSSYEESFSVALDLILSSDVFFNFAPFGIEVWSYEKEIVEVPIPIVPDTEINGLEFEVTPDPITFTLQAPEDTSTNRAPVAVSSITNETLQVGGSSTPIDVSSKFNDLDGDTLTYGTSSSDSAVATAQIAGSQLTIWAWTAGSTTITVTARDPNGLVTTQTFSVTVQPSTGVNRAPVAEGTISAKSLYVSGVSQTIDVSANFRDPDGDSLIFSATSDNTRIVTAEVLDNSRIRITPEANGSATVTVTASDGSLSATQRFSVIVSTLLIIGNRSPVAQGTINIQTLEVGDPSTTIDLSGYFRDPDGDTLTYTVTVSDANVLTAQRTGTSSVRLTPTGDGSTTVTVTASDGRLSVTQTFSVTVDPSDVDTTESSDVVVENISADYVTNYPGERYTVSVTVRNAGGRSAPNIRLRYYLSDDDTYSTDDKEYEDLDNFVGSLRSGDSRRESVNLDAPYEEGVYYIIARTDPVDNEQTSRNNYQAIKITVLPPAAPDLVVSLTADDYLVDPNEYFKLTALVRNQGDEDADDETTVRFYFSTDATLSPDDEEIETGRITDLRDGDTDDSVEGRRAPDKPGTYYYFACVDSVSNERITDNNCSDVVIINVRGPDLVIDSVQVDYRSQRHTTVLPGGIFELHSTFRNQGTDDAPSTKVRFYVSLDITLSSDDTEVEEEWLSSLDVGESSNDRTDWISPPIRKGVFYCFVCIDEVEDEIRTDNNCSAPIKITIRNVAPQAQGTIAPSMLDVGTPFPLNVSTYFTDQNNDTLAYNANSSDDNIATAVTSAAQVTITPKRAGTATITVTAQDSEFTATQTFVVTVTAPIVSAETWMPDPVLRAAIREALGLKPSETLTQEAMKGLTSLIASADPEAGPYITDITGLEHATQLTQLILRWHGIRDITPLRGLTQLEELGLGVNPISDITSLAGLTQLTKLSFWWNKISDITPLAGLTQLTELSLWGNKINDITPLAGLTQLTKLYLGYDTGGGGNLISDVTPLENLTSLAELYLRGNPITDYGPLRRLQAKTTQTISIDVDIGAAPEAQAAKTALLPNYPNPFNPETWIPYHLSKPADVTLTFYNVQGVMVRRIALGHRAAGVYYSRSRAAHWDGKNNLGEKVAAGLYFVKFRAGNYTSIRKMLIRK